jgi:hypothetical protein
MKKKSLTIYYLLSIIIASVVFYISSLQSYEKLIDDHGGHHDFYLYMANNGKEKDLEFLICELKRMGDIKANQPIVCTRAHLLGAIEKVSGVSIGPNYSDWVKWYETKKSKPFKPYQY